MKTWHIHIEGQVQGVGFRPYIFLLANQFKLNGWVINSVDGVHVEINALEKRAYEFYQELLSKAPALSRITRHAIYQSNQKYYENFQIIHSQSDGEPKLLVTPDFAICNECKSELHTNQNRRKDYPFITCTNCGPRFSIIQSLPYDRKTTAMDAFQMCAVCAEEYDNPLNRRYYSQTNSCSQCSIQLTLYNSRLDEIAKNSSIVIDLIVRFWKEGKIVAIKGIGGYLLTCDARNEKAIQELRERKYRPTKPFALMYPNLKILVKLVDLRKEEREELKNPVAPIVLLSPVIQVSDTFSILPLIAPNLNQIGVMLPYTPLYDLLLQKFGKPIVATSGNISNSPIVFEDEKAFKQLFPVADFILTNNRKIVVPQDDSVIKFTLLKRQKIILRRSRGLAPTYINAALELPNQNILATGAMLKSTFTFLHQGNTFISQYLGDLEHFDTLENYEHTVQHFFKLLDATPEVILADKHPQYASTQYAERLAQNLKVPFEQVQHHMAHFGAVLAENDLIHSEQPVLGVVWDGTGLGDDGQIWGGEFFKFEKYNFSRSSHFDYFEFILGDKMPKEPRISALSACWDLVGAEDFVREKFTETEWHIYGKMLQKGSALKTSSVGRIFDAVASLLGILDKQTYEGEAAMQLEALAEQYFRKHSWSFQESYFQKEEYIENIPTKLFMSGVIQDLKKGKAKDFIAAKFHYSLMKLIKFIAKELNTKRIAFSGGVFQNSVLVDLIIHHLKDEFELYFHKELSPNDENVSFGQLVCYQIQKIKT